LGAGAGVLPPQAASAPEWTPQPWDSGDAPALPPPQVPGGDALNAAASEFRPGGW